MKNRCPALWNQFDTTHFVFAPFIFLHFFLHNISLLQSLILCLFFTSPPFLWLPLFFCLSVLLSLSLSFWQGADSRVWTEYFWLISLRFFIVSTKHKLINQTSALLGVPLQHVATSALPLSPLEYLTSNETRCQ